MRARDAAFLVLLASSIGCSFGHQWTRVSDDKGAVKEKATTDVVVKPKDGDVRLSAQSTQTRDANGVVRQQSTSNFSLNQKLGDLKINVQSQNQR